MHAVFEMGPSLLFCPADRPDRFAKAAARADAVILDLEDAVSDDRKSHARQALVDNPLDPQTTVVRINTKSAAERRSDLEALAGTDYRFVMVSKCESAADLVGLDGLSVLAQMETPRGYFALTDLAEQPNVVALFWGSEDLAEGLGGVSSRDESGRYTTPIAAMRTALLYAAASSGKAAIDAIHTDFADLRGLREDAEDAARWGFAATACIHPNQVEVIREAYRPDDASVRRAQLIVESAKSDPAVFSLNGSMIDGPLILQAKRILARAAR